MLSNLDQLFRGYEPYQVVIELAVIWACVFLVFRFLKGTRGAGIIKGLAVLLVVVTLVIKVLGQESDAFGRLDYIYTKLMAVLAILLIVVFQPELRQAMIRLGQARFFRGTGSGFSKVVDTVSEAVEFLSKSQFGALIAIERGIRLGGLIEGGQMLDAQVNARLLESIFWPNSPLHDLGVVIRGDRVVAANVQFPLAEEGAVPAPLGSRHRAAVGVSLDSDCLVVVISEETGGISIVERGTIEGRIPRDQFKAVLAERLQSTPPAEAAEPVEDAAEPAEPAAGDAPPESAEPAADEPLPKKGATLAEELSP